MRLPEASAIVAEEVAPDDGCTTQRSCTASIAAAGSRRFTGELFDGLHERGKMIRLGQHLVARQGIVAPGSTENHQRRSMLSRSGVELRPDFLAIGCRSFQVEHNHPRLMLLSQSQASLGFVRFEDAQTAALQGKAQHFPLFGG